MKNILNVLLFVFIPLCLLIACNESKSEAKSIIYENTNYNFNLKLPQNWDGKYDVVETENKIIFYNKANKSSSGGELFDISIWSKEKWRTEGEELTKIIHLSKIGETRDKIFAINTPTDVQYAPDDETKKQEYLTMSNDVETIKATFEVKQ